MTLRKNNNQGGPIGISGLPKTQKTTKRVVDIILGRDHPAYTGPDSIGIIFFADEVTGENPIDPTSLPRAKPLNLNNYTVPVIGELVNVISSVSDEYYPELGGNTSFTSNYYTPAVNIHNNAGSNALPLNKKTKKKKNKTRETSPIFSFQEEFQSQSRRVARKQLDNYLYNLGYSAGRDSVNAPKYKLVQAPNGDYIFRLDDSKENKAKLGAYFKEKQNQNNLTPTEGGSIIQGKNGQRINIMTTGPDGANSVSRNVTDDPTDGNPNIGDSAMVLSLGNGSQENITEDAASVYLLENQSIPIDVASLRVASLKSTYTPIQSPLEIIGDQPPPVTPEYSTEGDELNIESQTISWDVGSPVSSSSVVEEVITNEEVVEEDPFDDPVFAALDEAVEEGFLTEDPEEWDELSGTLPDPILEGIGTDEPGDTTNDGVVVTDDQILSINYPANTANYNIQDVLAAIPENEKSAAYRKANAKAINKKAQKAWESGDYAKAVFTNKDGNIFPLAPPDENLTMQKATDKNIKWLVIHCTAGWNMEGSDPYGIPKKTPASTMHGFFQGRNWRDGGYHWIVMGNGIATRVYPDDKVTNGALPSSEYNKHGIHLNWIGGFNATWQYRDMTGNPIPKKYNKAGKITNKSYHGKPGVSESLGVSVEEAYRRLFGFGNKNLTGWGNGDPETLNKNLITRPQAFSLYQLIKKYVLLYPNIKVVGHNQCSTKICPLFDVPTFMRLKGYPNNTIDGQLARGWNKELEKEMPQSFNYPTPLKENAEWLAQAI